MTDIKLGSRLLAVGDAVTGDYLCDVGTDHALLPIYLCETGKISRAVASDINEGPLLRAEKNIREHGLSAKIEVKRTNGLSGLSGYGFTDISIAGMGGILISEILGEDAAKHSSLILQPMRHAHLLRQFLISSGFEITAESLATDGKRVYQIISAKYTGKNTVYSAAELYLGRLNIENRKKYPDEFSLHCRHLLYMLGEKSGGGDESAGELAGEIRKILKED